MLEFLLYENAFDSISHGLEHLGLAEKSGSKKDYKYALLAIFQGTELLLKQLLCLKNPIYIFDKNSLYDKCANPMQPTLKELFNCKSLEINKLCSEVIKYYPSNFKSSNLNIIEKVAKERNRIQHFGFQIEKEDLKKQVLELYHQVISPSFRLIGDTVECNSFGDYLNRELERIFNFLDIADKEEELIKIKNEDYTRMACHHCGIYSLFVFYDRQSYPVRYYCSSCTNEKNKIFMNEFLICPECGVPSLIYDVSIEAGICLWYRCANNKDGGVLVDMVYCTTCREYKIEGKCDCNIDEED